MNLNSWLKFWLVCAGVVFLWGQGCQGTDQRTTENPMTPAVDISPTSAVALTFDGERAYEDVLTQVEFGPRTPGSPGHAQVVEWMVRELEAAGWATTLQEGEYRGFPILNVIAQRPGADPEGEWIIIGAHFDTRIHANSDPDPARQTDPVPGANDGASGVAVLLELARVFPSDLNKNVWLVFFDAEDNGSIEGREWFMGASYFVDDLLAQAEGLPDAAVVVDMVGDANQDIYLELNSDPTLATDIWGVAGGLGYGDRIILMPRHRILDDHIPFRNAGIPAVLMIDFDYPYWHTVEDTPDKLSAESLEAVGATLLAWLQRVMP